MLMISAVGMDTACPSSLATTKYNSVIISAVKDDGCHQNFLYENCSLLGLSIGNKMAVSE